MSPASLGIRLSAELGSIAERCGCELLDATFRGGVLRLVLDRQPGVTLADCERVSREASALLDVEDFASGQYVLEVSSPGLDREFYRESDYDRFSGQTVRITWRDPETGNKRTDIGVLESVSRTPEKRVLLTSDNTQLTIPLSDVVTTRLEPEL